MCIRDSPGRAWGRMRCASRAVSYTHLDVYKRQNNNRTWFEENRSQYEALVREPARQFIAEMAPLLETFAPHFRADPRKSGGSLMLSLIHI